MLTWRINGADPCWWSTIARSVILSYLYQYWSTVNSKYNVTDDDADRLSCNIANMRKREATRGGCSKRPTRGLEKRRRKDSFGISKNRLTTEGSRRRGGAPPSSNDSRSAWWCNKLRRCHRRWPRIDWVTEARGSRKRTNCGRTSSKVGRNDSQGRGSREGGGTDTTWDLEKSFRSCN